MLRLHMIPTSGDATLLRFEENGKEVNILIDGGNRRNDCLSYLKSEGVTRLNLLIASHLDGDHIRGLRRVADEITVDELWITDVSAFVRPAAESRYMLMCFYASKLVVDGAGVRSGHKFAVYEGFQRQIGPFFLEVFSPPKSLHEYLKRPRVIDDILKSPKGQSISRYIYNEIEKCLEKEDVGDDRARREDIVSEVIERFAVDVPQMEEMEGLLENEAVNWREYDRFYESARSLFNDISIVVKITYDYADCRETFLFPGDLTNWSLLIANHPGAIKGCITKVPHHGSYIYVNYDEYAQSLYSQEMQQDFWKKLMYDWRFFLEEWYHLVRHYGKAPLPWPMLFTGTGPRLSGDLDSFAVYEHLSPKHSLIFPFRSSFRLPRLDVRNAIRANSSRTSCMFEQGGASASHWSGNDPCMDCFGCHERDTAIVLDLA
jgi:hypothetical protein